MSVIETTSPRGVSVSFEHREGTTDLSTIFATFSPWGGPPNDEYHLADIYPSTFIDIGGHIGTITVAVLVDNPKAYAAIVEPLPENIELIRENLARNGVTDRAVVIEGGIGAKEEVRVGYTLARIPDADEVHRFIGSPVADDYAGEAITVGTHTLASLIKRLRGCDLLKIDCEGCEWVALTSPAIAKVKRIVGEYHGGPHAEGVHALLDATHEVTTVPHDHGGTGMFDAVLR